MLILGSDHQLGTRLVTNRYLKKCLSGFPDEYGDRVMELERRLDELTR
jgi:hypothetical protein